VMDRAFAAARERLGIHDTIDVAVPQAIANATETESVTVAAESNDSDNVGRTTLILGVDADRKGRDDG
jgi:hypothetical protein